MTDLDRRIAAARGCQEPGEGVREPSDLAWVLCLVFGLTITGGFALVTAWCN